MKKALFIGLAVLISVAFMTTAFAQTTEKKETITTTTTTPEKQETVTKTTKTKHMTFTGKVTNMDTAEKMMTVKGRKGEMTFDVSNAKMKGEANADDRVTVKYREKDGKMIASSVIRGKSGQDEDHHYRDGDHHNKDKDRNDEVRIPVIPGERETARLRLHKRGGAAI